MTDESDYEELVDKTISEIKEELESSDKYDLKKVLEAEKSNKDRKTLKSWLEGRIEDQEEEEKTEEEKKEEKPGKKAEMKSVVSESEREDYKSPWKKPSTNFLLGILIGVAVTALLMYSPSTGAAPDTITATDASSMASDYITDQLGSQQQINISVVSVNDKEYGDLYVVNLEVSSAQGSQNIDVYVTKESGLMFLGPLAGAQPIDLSEGTPVGNIVANTTGR